MLLDSLTCCLVIKKNRQNYVDMLLSMAVGLQRTTEVLLYPDYEIKVKTLVQCLISVHEIESDPLTRIKMNIVILKFPVSPLMAAECMKEYVEALLRLFESWTPYQVYGAELFTSLIRHIDLQLLLPVLALPVNCQRLNNAITLILAESQDSQLIYATMELVSSLRGVLNLELKADVSIPISRQAMDSISISLNFKEAPEQSVSIPIDVTIQESVQFIAANLISKDYKPLSVKVAPSYVFMKGFPELAGNSLIYARKQLKERKIDAYNILQYSQVFEITPQPLSGVDLRLLPPSETVATWDLEPVIPTKKLRISVCTLFGTMLGYMDADLHDKAVEAINRLCDILVLFIMQHTAQQSTDIPISSDTMYSTELKNSLFGPPLHPSGIGLVIPKDEAIISVFLDVIAALLSDGKEESCSCLKYFFNLFWTKSLQLVQDPFWTFCRCSSFFDKFFLAMSHYAFTESWRFRLALCDICEDITSYLPAVWSEHIISVLVRFVFATVKVRETIFIHCRSCQKMHSSPINQFYIVFFNVFFISISGLNWMECW